MINKGRYTRFRQKKKKKWTFLEIPIRRDHQVENRENLSQVRNIEDKFSYD